MLVVVVVVVVVVFNRPSFSVSYKNALYKSTVIIIIIIIKTHPQRAALWKTGAGRTSFLGGGDMLWKLLWPLVRDGWGMGTMVPVLIHMWGVYGCYSSFVCPDYPIRWALRQSPDNQAGPYLENQFQFLWGKWNWSLQPGLAQGEHGRPHFLEKNSSQEERQKSVYVSYRKIGFDPCKTQQTLRKYQQIFLTFTVTEQG